MSNINIDKVKIRPARPDDGKDVAEMTAELSKHEKNPPPKFTVDAFQRDCFGHDTILSCSVAEYSDQIIGHVISYRTYDIQDAQHRRYIADLFVRKEFRRKGVGLMLIASVCHLARLKKETIVYWETEHHNKLAQVFYEKIGAKGRDMASYYLPRKKVINLARK